MTNPEKHCQDLEVRLSGLNKIDKGEMVIFDDEAQIFYVVSENYFDTLEEDRDDYVRDAYDIDEVKELLNLVKV